MSPNLLRVDPSATTYDSAETPMEIAATRDFPEVLNVLAEFTELSDKVKLLQLYNLMYSDIDKNSKEEFQSILRTLSVDLVSSLTHSHFLYTQCPISSICQVLLIR